MPNINANPEEWCEEEVKKGHFANETNCMDKISPAKGGKRTRRHHKRTHRKSTHKRRMHRKRTHKRRH